MKNFLISEQLKNGIMQLIGEGTFNIAYKHVALAIQQLATLPEQKEEKKESEEKEGQDKSSEEEQDVRDNN